MSASEDKIRLPDKTEYQDRLDQAKEARSVVKDLKALFKGRPEPQSHPGYTGTEDRRLKDKGWDDRDGPIGDGSPRRASDDTEAWAPSPTVDLMDPAQIRAHLAPAPWAGVPAAIQTLRPLGRYDRVTDDAWRLVKAFCEARAQDPGDQGQEDS